MVEPVQPSGRKTFYRYILTAAFFVAVPFVGVAVKPDVGRVLARKLAGKEDPEILFQRNIDNINSNFDKRFEDLRTTCKQQQKILEKLLKIDFSKDIDVYKGRLSRTMSLEKHSEEYHWKSVIDSFDENTTAVRELINKPSVQAASREMTNLKFVLNTIHNLNYLADSHIEVIKIQSILVTESEPSKIRESLIDLIGIGGNNPVVNLDDPIASKRLEEVVEKAKLLLRELGLGPEELEF